MATRSTTRDIRVIRSFPPISDARARVLILGTMPGAASLAAGRYYAHPHNAFWRIVGALLDLPDDATYEARVRRLRAARIAVWDVLESCTRPGSLDSAIDPRSARVHDFAAFFAAHPRIERVCFNGGYAEACFRRHVAPQLEPRGLELVRLPSTSPAHAARTFAQKLRAWRVVLP